MTVIPAVSRTRRALIQGLVLALVGDRAGSSGGLGRRVGAVTARLPAGPVEAAARKLSHSELDCLLALAEVLVAGRTLSPEERGYLIDHIEQRTQEDGGFYFELYRKTVALLDGLAGAKFTSLDRAQRGAVIARHRLFSSAVRPEENLGPFPKEAREVRTRAVPDLIGGYYASPAGWAAVGYSAFPGRCGDLARYTSPER